MTAARSATIWKARLALAACALWTAAMLYLVVRSANPPIVSRPQVLSADAIVEGVLEIVSQELRLKVDAVRWSRRPLSLADLPPAGLPIGGQQATWMTTGARAVAPLQEISPGRFSVQPIPFEVESPKMGYEAGPAPIYPATKVVIRQLDELAPKKSNP